VDPQSQIELCGSLVRYTDKHDLVRRLMHPLALKDALARDLFLRVLPQDVNAFCIRCRNPLELNSDGYPKGKVEGRPRMRRKLCTECENARDTRRGAIWGQGPYRRMTRAQVTEAFDKILYCGRCGSVNRDDHYCGSVRPDWIPNARTAEGHPAPPGHWSDWRSE